MIKRGILVLILTAAVLLGAYLGSVRYLSEAGTKTVELAVDLNDLKKMAAYDKKPLDVVLREMKKMGFSEVGVFEETLPDANALGELYYAKGSGILRFRHLSPDLLALSQKGKIRSERTYIYAPEDAVRRRVYNQLKWALGEKAIRFLGKEIMEVDELEEEIRALGLGISESQRKYLENNGFLIVPRVWNDPRYHLGNIEPKISALADFGEIIFDGEEILGYPDAIPALADALKKFKVKYGYIEIVKQDGDLLLKRLMGNETIRVHSVPKDELVKINKEEALDRFVRAIRERNVRLIYLRPFLPPQVDAFPVEYNLKYFKELKSRIEASGFILGKAEKMPVLKPNGWQILLLGAGVLIGALFLLNEFVVIPFWLMYLLLLLGMGGLFFLGAAGHALFLQKGLAFSAALVFPSSAVITTFSRRQAGTVLSVINVLAETGIGIFLMLGLLADSRFMSGVETFPAVKLSLTLPVLIVTAYFVLRMGGGSLRQRIQDYLSTRVSLAMVLVGGVVLGALAVLVARSGNFVLPVPGFEKYFRNWLEWLLFVRPRTKEFLVGYPFLYLAALYRLKGGRTWLWLLAAIGVIGPISVFNSFSHIHTPIVISLLRSFNGLVLGLLVGYLAGLFAGRYYKGEVK